jgi:micrococcal nuclease
VNLEEGLKSRDRLRELIMGKDIYKKTIKDRTEKYGRYLAEVYII